MTTPWSEITLDSAGQWLSGGTPSKQAPALWVGTLPWVSPKDMKRPRIDEAIDHVAEAAVGNGTQLAPIGSLLMVVRGMILAHTFPVAMTTGPVTFNQDIKALVPGKGWSSEFLLYWLQFTAPEVLRLVDVANHGTKRLPSERLFALSLPQPSMAEQRKIAAILSSVDDAIEATQTVIAQLQVVKKAMMAELLTRGLPGKHTRFKQTDIGELPEDWQVVELGSVLATIDAGWSPQCETRPAAPEEWGVLKLSAVTSGVYIDSEQKALPKALAPRPDVEVRAGDVLLARASGVLELVGRTVLVRATRPRLMLSDKVLRLRPAASRLHGEFLTLAMATEAVRSRLLSTTGGSHMRNVSQSALRVLKLPLPSPDEQAQISATIGSVDLRTESEVEALATLRDFKAALMSVLLTGEVRVKPDEDAA